MNILVTGGCGYIGSSLLPRLLEYHLEWGNQTVTCVDNLSYGSPFPLMGLFANPRFTFHAGDVCELDQEFIGRADVVIHLAALVGEPVCRKHPGRCWKVNHSATVRLVRLLRPEQRLIYLNTNSGYGQTSGAEECTEEWPLNPISDYGKSKVEAEKEVLSHSNAVSLRLATVFGPSGRMRFDLLVNQFTRELYEKKMITLYEKDFVRSYVHIQDVVSAIIHMIQCPLLTGVFNVSACNLTKGELAVFIAYLLNLPDDAVKSGEGRDPDRRNYRVSSQRLLDTGFRFGYSLADGVRGVVNICKNISPALLNAMSNQ